MTEYQKSKVSDLPEDLFYRSVNGFDKMTPELEAEIEAYCDAYKKFLDHGKTERLCHDNCVHLAEERGFVPYQVGVPLNPGDRVYYSGRGKTLLLAVMGSKPLSEGANLSVAHHDSPRLDMTPRPLFEEAEMAYFSTQRYGGTRAYQWVAQPLALHGCVMLRNGSTVSVSIGEAEDEPQFMITDLLPHLGDEQQKKPLAEAFPSDVMRVFVGSRPLKSAEEGKRFKGSVLATLYQKYGIVEEDLISAELEAVPAGKARDIGFDRSMISSYGHDDRVCVYAQLAALFDLEIPEKTAVCIISDKEEIGSDGVTGIQSAELEYFMGNLCRQQGVDLWQCYTNSLCISADVTAAYDPSYKSVYDVPNAAMANHGVALIKYTGGSGNKFAASDASAEAMGKIRKLLNADGVLWQSAIMGRAEAGGGGTMAKFIARRNIDTVDAGVAVLSMHAPYEMVSKIDCYMTYRAIRAVYMEKNN